MRLKAGTQVTTLYPFLIVAWNSWMTRNPDDSWSYKESPNSHLEPRVARPHLDGENYPSQLILPAGTTLTYLGGHRSGFQSYRKFQTPEGKEFLMESNYFTTYINGPVIRK